MVTVTTASATAAAMPATPRPPSVFYAVGSNVCSLAMRSIHETKDNFLLICIGFLEALDRLQEKLNLPLALVKDLKRKLAKMVDRSLIRPVSPTTHGHLKKAHAVGDLIAESETWGEVASPHEVKGFVQWLIAVMKSLNGLALAGTIGVCRRIFILIMNFPGVPTACTLFCRIFDMVERALHLTNESAKVAVATPRKSKRPALKRENYMGDPSLTAVVLEYREKECMVPQNINRRIQRVMHFQIPLRSFEATVRLPTDNDASPHRQAPVVIKRVDSIGTAALGPSSSSPRSIPVSPLARKRYQVFYQNFSDDIVYRARDRLRQERAATLTGERDLQIPRFNKRDCDDEIDLSCAGHCAMKIGSGMYRSVRGNLPIQRNRYVYFEMLLSEKTSPIAGDKSSSVLNRIAGSTVSDLSVCVGVSPHSMPLNALVGTARYSVGFYSAGHVLVGGHRRSFISVDVGFDCPSTVGVLVHIEDEGALHEYGAQAMSGVALAELRFSVNGIAVRESTGQVAVIKLPFPSHSELYPTLSLHNQNVRVYGQFSAPDIVDLNVAEFDLPEGDPVEIWCLDGLRLTTRARPPL